MSKRNLLRNALEVLAPSITMVAALGIAGCTGADVQKPQTPQASPTPSCEENTLHPVTDVITLNPKQVKLIYSGGTIAVPPGLHGDGTDAPDYLVLRSNYPEHTRMAKIAAALHGMPDPPEYKWTEAGPVPEGFVRVQVFTEPLCASL